MRMKGSRALKKTKCGKSGGLDGISVKRLKREGNAMIKWIDYNANRLYEKVRYKCLGQ